MNKIMEYYTAYKRVQKWLQNLTYNDYYSLLHYKSLNLACLRISVENFDDEKDIVFVKSEWMLS